MQYRIELSPSRQGHARISFPGRVIGLAVGRHVGPVWLVGVSEPGSAADEGSVAVRADNAGEAVWRVAQATVRAVALLTGTAIVGEIKPSEAEYLGNLS
jgi:hypothetical protein